VSSGESRPPQPTHLDALTRQLVAQTAPLNWSDLARQYASGRLLGVARSLDLIVVGKAMHHDDSDQLVAWLKNKLVYTIDERQAIKWQRIDACFWTVVIAPFVVIQHRTNND
jgi:hypothetical protein